MKVLDEKIATDLRIFLIDVLGDDMELHKTKTRAILRYVWQYQKPLICKRKWVEKNRDCYLQRNCLNSVFVCKDTQIDRLRNIFFQVNSGKVTLECRPFFHYTEGRKKADIISYNAFMLDFDLKFGYNQHYQGEELISEKNKLYETLQKKLPLEPDYIVESRNGFHVYYLIPTNDRKLSSYYWHAIEYGIFDYVNRNISNCVDPAVKKSNQIMRLPFSLHRKDDDENDFVVYIRHERNKKIKSDLIAEGKYSSAQFAYSLKNIIKSFKLENRMKSAELKCKKETQKKLEKQIEQKNLSIIKDKYPAIEALLKWNINFFIFLQIQSPKLPMSTAEATEYIKSVDIRTVLKIPSQPLNEAFSSLFYPDIHPSDYFATNPKTGMTSYYCRREDKWYNNIFDIVYRLKKLDQDEITEKERWRYIFKFMFLAFGLNVVRDWALELNRVTLENIENFRKIINHSKVTKYLKCAENLYYELMKVWKEHVYKNKIDFRTTHMTIAAEWIGKKINTARSTVQKELLLLEYVGLIKKIDSVYKKKKYFANEYQFMIITDKDIDEIISKVEIIKKNLDKPLKQASRKKLGRVGITPSTINPNMFFKNFVYA